MHEFWVSTRPASLRASNSEPSQSALLSHSADLPHSPAASSTGTATPQQPSFNSPTPPEPTSPDRAGPPEAHVSSHTGAVGQRGPITTHPTTTRQSNMQQSHLGRDSPIAAASCSGSQDRQQGRAAGAGVMSGAADSPGPAMHCLVGFLAGTRAEEMSGLRGSAIIRSTLAQLDQIFGECQFPQRHLVILAKAALCELAFGHQFAHQMSCRTALLLLFNRQRLQAAADMRVNGQGPVGLWSYSASSLLALCWLYPASYCGPAAGQTWQQRWSCWLITATSGMGCSMARQAAGEHIQRYLNCLYCPVT